MPLFDTSTIGRSLRMHSARARFHRGCLSALLYGLVAVLCLTLSLGSFVSGSSAFVGPSGFLIDSPLRVQEVDILSTLISLQSQLTSQAAEIAALQSLVASQAVTIVSLQQYDEANTVQVAAIIDAAAVLNGTVTVVKSTVAVHTTELTALDQLTERHTTEIAALESDLTAVNATLSGEVSDIQLAATALTERVTEDEAAAVILTTRVSAAENATAALTTRVTAAENAAAALTVRVTSAETAAALLTARVSAAEITATALAVRVTSAESLTGSTTLSTTVTGLNGTVGEIVGLTGTSALVTTVESTVSVNALQTSWLTFLKSQPTCTGQNLVSTSTFTANTNIVLQAFSKTSDTNGVFSFDGSSLVTIYGARVGDVDEGLTRRFAISATLRIDQTDDVSFDWQMLHTTLLATINIYPAGSDSNNVEMSSTVSGVVTVAPNATLVTGLRIGNVARGTAVVDTFTYFSIALI